MHSTMAKDPIVSWADKKFEHLAKGFTSMAQPVLLVWRCLGKRSAKNGNEKDRIVAEASCSRGLVLDDAFEEVGNHRQDAATLGNRCDANKTRATIISMFPLHFAQQLANPVRVGGTRPSVTRRVDPWSTPQGGHNKARIIGQDELSRKSAVV